jgi:integration host factor subunit beta
LSVRAGSRAITRMRKVGQNASGNDAMLKSELVQKIAKANPHLPQRDAEHVVDAILDAITEAMSRGERVELRGFGAFTAKHRGSRIGRNPRTGVKVRVSQKFAPLFRASKDMHHRLNGA